MQYQNAVAITGRGIFHYNSNPMHHSFPLLAGVNKPIGSESITQFLSRRNLLGQMIKAAANARIVALVRPGSPQ